MDPGQARRSELQTVRSVFGKLSAVILAVAALSAISVQVRADQRGSSDVQVRPATPIWHLAVIYDENVSFDHYFGTYPEAENPRDEPRFVGAPGTPAVDNLRTAGLLTNNRNASNPRNGGRWRDLRDWEVAWLPIGVTFGSPDREFGFPTNDRPSSRELMSSDYLANLGTYD